LIGTLAMGCRSFLAHDLIRLSDASAVTGSGPCPEWVRPALEVAPWVVVRRQAGRDGLIPVGVRGRGRSRRWGGWAPIAAVSAHVRPEELPPALGRIPARRVVAIRAFRNLAKVEELMSRLGWTWGPTGSVGFELASGRATATRDSDLDLIVRAHAPLDRRLSEDLIADLALLGGRADVLVETPSGAVSLVEYARSGAPIVLRTVHGPRLIRDPWRPIFEEIAP
jgi:phosphoribosyl-dephospho-CoA transferase